MTQYLYLTREQWGGTWIGTPPIEIPLDPEMYVHHVGGGAWMGGTVGPGTDASRAAAIRVFQDLNYHAQNTKGYQFLDYDLLVWYDRFNNICWIAEGRGIYRSAATRDRNEQGEAVCVCGNFQLREPMPAELEGTARAIVIGRERGWIRPEPTILGHRDNPAHPNDTSCPGQYLYIKLPWIRSRFAELVADPTPPDPQPPFPPSPPSFIVTQGVGDMHVVAHESGKDSFWYSMNGGLTRYGIRSPGQMHSILMAGAVDAKTGAKLTPSNWGGASVLTVSELNDRLGPVG